MTSVRRLAGTAFMTVVVTACGGWQPSVLPTEAIVTAADGLRTFRVTREIDGNPVSCGLPAVTPHVTGALAGDQSQAEPVWLVDAAGERLSVVWPESYRAAFTPSLELIDETGAVVARDGDLVELTQVAPVSAAGTYADPYIASCWLFGNVYPLVR